MSPGPASRALVGAALAAALTTAACANAPVSAPPASAPSSSAPAATAPSPSAPPPSAEARHALDVSYAQMMLPHVTQGLELTTIAAGRVADPDLARLVTEMDHADVEEQGQLTGQLHVWRAPVPGERGVPAGRMPGMADDATLDRLRSARGPAFDRAWLAAMIAHHEGGIAMSRDYLARGAGGELAGIAATTISTGGRQLDRMRALQTRT